MRLIKLERSITSISKASIIFYKGTMHDDNDGVFIINIILECHF